MNLKDKVQTIQASAKTPSILVVGDLMVDHYITGSASRLSPEAPVPVVNVKNETTTLGGAGNVVQNLVSLGAKVVVAGIIGNDSAGGDLISILSKEGVETDTIIKDGSRPTTVKTRVLVGSHQLVRVDREVTDEVSETISAELIDKLNGYLDEVDMVLLSDYNKGLFSPFLTQAVIRAANARGKRVIIDPKGLNYKKYEGAFIIKPNRKELAEAAKTEKINSVESLQQAAGIILEQTGAEYIVVTLSEEGMVILSENGYSLLPVKATEVFDVTGAGDTVLATMAYFMAGGLTLEESCELANHAAAIVIRRVGSATTTIQEIIEDIERGES
ncbi:D-beta-D-heptose 7-phosphate kinase/D-beta-D-heptose 1-phosphate adenosyltransferase [Mucilaginibacter oryzae]|uniref:D-beta-D-heptose 7-phosphate kinase/D-beta-D-heptose 1-phosphate adenosyltransferase n=1 Tax=Mucilaginibacter oryzae TaxID=468058 RepID=A0A316HCY7_9SPHI|nr:D-glycero-beta-D-manno-heptose-7-phosphate kinase [Mucilaginibacter oryzae]PWK78123.1 D-beta-D-heptose 7-phosphate kinase/D-beta-D-heptose 1-phosphate adenosyltransferase [Mucilaginibacter oryzae]